MSTRQTYEKGSLASGEISPALHGATDLRAYQTGLSAQENFVTLQEGVVTRCPGTRFLYELKDESQRGRLWPFRYTTGEYYMLVFNGGVMRVMLGGGLVTSGGGLFEMPIPWSEAQLRALRAAPQGKTLTFTVSGGRIRVVTRVEPAQWTVQEYRPLNGPIDTQNLDRTITVLPSATDGGITLSGQNSPFNAGMVGGTMRIDEASATLTPLWSAGENLTQTLVPLPAPAGFVGDMSDTSYLLDGDDTTAASKENVRTCFAGFRYAPGQAISAITVIGFDGSVTAAAQEVTLELWGRNTLAPITGTDGVLLGRKSFIDSGNAGGVTVYSTDTATAYSYIWFRLVSPTGNAKFSVVRADITARPVGYPVILRRWGENIYEALSDGVAGTQPPIHDADDAVYGGINWRFRSKTYGFVRIDSYAGPNSVSGVVTSRLPDSVLLAASYRWWPPSWSDGRGWPTNVQQHQQKLLFTRTNEIWITRPPPARDFMFTPDDDSSIATSLTPVDEHSQVDIQWMASSGIVVIGASDMEWMLRAPGSNDMLQAKTIDPTPDSQEGSRAGVPPAKVDRGVVFVGRDGKRLHYLKFDALTQQLAPEEISVFARHILGAGVVKMAWQKDPHKVLWALLEDGALAAATFMPAQKVVAFHRRPMINAFIEDIAELPSLDDSRVDLYLLVRREINGQTRRFIEILQPFFQPRNVLAPTAEGAWFVDCGISRSGAPTLRVTGANHLIGQTVAVFADGAMQSKKVVDAQGGVDLDQPSSEVVIGIPQIGRLRDLPRSLQLQGGTTRGKRQRSSRVIVDVLHAGGGVARVTYPVEERNADPGDTPYSDIEFDDLIETGADDYGAPIKLFTGQIPLTVQSESADSVVTEILCDDAMPMTVRSIVPELIVEGD